MTTSRPRTKPSLRVGRDGRLVVVRESRAVAALPDPDGLLHRVAALADGSRTTAELVAAAGAPADATRGALAALDDAGLLEDAAADAAGHDEREAGNLAFFGAFADLGTARGAFQARLRAARVLQLGVGGVGSTVLLDLAGLGVGSVTVVDCDRVEARNLGRQFLYDERDVGQPKVGCAVARARAQNRTVRVEGVERRITGAADVADLLPGVDLVVSVIDTPPEVREWVNEACVAAGVPLVAGGMQVTKGLFYSVDPGRSGCVACWLTLARRAAPDLADQPQARENSTIGPAASLLGASIAMEAVRYLTRCVAPVAAGRPWEVDVAGGGIEPLGEWPRLADCPVCADAAVSTPA